jgi:hypothetical protein
MARRLCARTGSDAFQSGGQIVFTEPNMLNPQIAVQKNIPAIKRRLGDSPDETAFFRWGLRRRLRKAGFKSIQIGCFDFLHPKIPPSLIPLISSVGEFCERVRLLSEKGHRPDSSEKRA